MRARLLKLVTEMRLIQLGFYVLLVVLAATIAAVLAHVTIDVLGDFLLAHDTFDGVEHHSRAVFLGIFVLVAGLVALRFVWELMGRGVGSLRELLRRLRTARGSSPIHFVLHVIAVAVVGLVLMEFLDCTISGSEFRDVADLMGGSLLLGGSTTTVLGAIVAIAVRALFGLIVDWEPCIAAVISRFLCCACACAPAGEQYNPEARFLGKRASPLARRGGKRAPPPFVAASNLIIF
jgi:hypothetical protein